MNLIPITIDDRPLSVQPGTTIFDAAQSIGIDIPVLCHHPNLNPIAVCRICVVEVKGSRVLVPACIRQVEKDMVIQTHSPRVQRSRRILTELLLTDHPTPCKKQEQTGDCELEKLATAYGIQGSRFARKNGGIGVGKDESMGAGEGGSKRNTSLRPFPPVDLSSPVIAVDHDVCILCDRCIRACSDLQVNEVIGRAYKGIHTKISFDMDQPMGKSSCVSCGECMAYCPTGALTDKPLTAITDFKNTRPVHSLCPYCGVGCSITYQVADHTIVRVTGRPDGPANQGRLCVKGRYGFDYINHPERLTVPLIRKPEYPKQLNLDKSNSPEYSPWEAFREATWEEALELAASKFLWIKKHYGSKALAGFGSAKCSNEDNYLFQKLIRAVFGTNNVDHCTRLCHASSVAALMETIGSGAVSNIFADVLQAQVALVIGANPVENHPVAATFIKQAAKKGTTLIVIDPRYVDLARHADYFIQFKPGTDVALLNGFLHVIIQEGLVNEKFVQERTEGFEKLRETVTAYTPEWVEKLTGVSADLVRKIARLYATAERSMIFWGMGISQHSTGTDNARNLVNLALVTGHIGRPGTGLHPLRGQNNVQGASDVGLIPFVYTDYQKVNDPAVKKKFESAWGVPLDPEPGLTVVEIMNEILKGTLKGMYMMGENPFLSDPNINKVKKCLASLEFLVVQDIFLTETAEFADVILPGSSFAEKEGTYTNTDRRVQLARKAIESPGQARMDWQIIADLSTRMGYPMNYASAEEIFREIASLTPSYAGLNYERLTKGGILWPSKTPEDPGTSVLFTETFPSGRGKFIPVEFAPAKELPDADYPFVLNTGRVLPHWHTGTMTRRSKALDEISPEPYVDVNPIDLDRLGIQDGEKVKVSSRRGTITLKVRASTRVSPGNVFIPFHFKEAAANVLTNDVLDPYGKIPEFKFCAVSIQK
jgi:formate dehydrogenase major subunit